MNLPPSRPQGMLVGTSLPGVGPSTRLYLILGPQCPSEPTPLAGEDPDFAVGGGSTLVRSQDGVLCTTQVQCWPWSEVMRGTPHSLLGGPETTPFPFTLSANKPPYFLILSLQDVM